MRRGDLEQSVLLEHSEREQFDLPGMQISEELAGREVAGVMGVVPNLVFHEGTVVAALATESTGSGEGGKHGQHPIARS